MRESGFIPQKAGLNVKESLTIHTFFLLHLIYHRNSADVSP
jgi:hypothetical protein